MSKRIVRNYPAFNLQKALAISQKIQDERAGRPFKRLLLAESLDIKPGSSNFRDLLSASHKYGLTEGSEKSAEISLTALGIRRLMLETSKGTGQRLRKPHSHRRFSKLCTLPMITGNYHPLIC